MLQDGVDALRGELAVDHLIFENFGHFGIALSTGDCFWLAMKIGGALFLMCLLGLKTRCSLVPNVVLD